MLFSSYNVTWMWLCIILQYNVTLNNFGLSSRQLYVFLNRNSRSGKYHKGPSVMWTSEDFSIVLPGMLAILLFIKHRQSFNILSSTSESSKEEILGDSFFFSYPLFSSGGILLLKAYSIFSLCFFLSQSLGK